MGWGVVGGLGERGDEIRKNKWVVTEQSQEVSTAQGIRTTTQ